LGLCALKPASLASMPLALSAETSAVAARSSFPRFSGCKWISTFVAATDPEAGRLAPCVRSIPQVFHGTCIHPASISAGCSSHQKSACSPLFAAIPLSKNVNANRFNFSVIEASCSGVGRRGALNLASSNWASTAFWFASAARALASTAFSSDLRLNSSWRSPAMWPNLISIATPIATRLFARAEPHCSKNESYGGWMAAIATSAITPATIRLPPHHSQRSHDPIERSKSPSLALIMPFGRRHAGKGLASLRAAPCTSQMQLQTFGSAAPGESCRPRGHHSPSVRDPSAAIELASPRLSGCKVV
jgi:hypothetical protein